MCSSGARSVTPVGNARYVTGARPATQIQRTRWYRATAVGVGAMSALRVLGVGADDVAYQPVTHHVRVAQVAEPDPFDAGQDPLDLQQPGVLPVGQIDLRLVPGDHSAGVYSQP